MMRDALVAVVLLSCQVALSVPAPHAKHAPVHSTKPIPSAPFAAFTGDIVPPCETFQYIPFTTSSATFSAVPSTATTTATKKTTKRTSTRTFVSTSTSSVTASTTTTTTSLSTAMPTERPAKWMSVAPFVDTTAWPPANLISIANTTGCKFYTLAFIVADPANGNPSWGGYYPAAPGSDFNRDLISGVRALGGDVCISFGGAANQELAFVTRDADALARKYQSVIDTYAAKCIDFDIEGSATADKASVNMRNQVLARIKAANPGVRISYTLPVLPSGLAADGLNVLKSAVSAGFTPDLVNIMAMDYGAYEAPDGQTKMGAYAIQAGQSTWAQLKSIGLPSTKVGITPMIGKNDVAGEVFQLADATLLVDWAKQASWVAFLSFWSINRDKTGSGSDITYQSGIPQSPWDFTRRFLQFA